MAELITGYFDKGQISDRRAYVSRNKIALALRGLEYFYMTYGEGLRQPETDQMIEGQRLHLATLEPEEWRTRKVVHRFENLRSKEGKDWETRVRREYPNAIIMSQHDAMRYDRIVDRIRTHRLAGHLIENAIREKHGYCVCPRTGAQLYSRPDLVTPEGWLGEFKFVRSIDLDDFGSQQFREKWFMQLAFYNFVDAQIRGRRLTGNCFYIAVEHQYPHAMAVITLDPDFERMGEALWNLGLDKLLACLKVDPQIKNFEVWRALSNQATELRPKPWMLDRSPATQQLHGTIGG